MLDEWIDFHSSYVVAGKFSLPPGTKAPSKQRALGTLWCQFDSGYVAVYENVPYIVWEQLLAAESKGKYHHAAIRGRPYKEGSRDDGSVIDLSELPDVSAEFPD